ncbi:PhnD/SsuA/transferrin family substrate-binding protein [Psychromonas sp. KJ10-10]|uniref:PhnD/SsuA/transferrin family substrate-binding protein n=1 Tax=Psychromonas sp. KJ10-10 TaxID=3391823 RepID=UPI0039B699C6
MPTETLSTLKTIWKSEKYTSHAIATHPRINALSRQKILKALVNMSHSEQGKVLLKKLTLRGLKWL